MPRIHAQEMTKARAQRDYRPNWDGKCENCGASPTMRVSGLCGPCHWGTAEATGGGWWDEAKDDFDSDFLEAHLPEA